MGCTQAILLLPLFAVNKNKHPSAKQTMPTMKTSGSTKRAVKRGRWAKSFCWRSFVSKILPKNARKHSNSPTNFSADFCRHRFHFCRLLLAFCPSLCTSRCRCLCARPQPQSTMTRSIDAFSAAERRSYSKLSLMLRASSLWTRRSPKKRTLKSMAAASAAVTTTPKTP